MSLKKHGWILILISSLGLVACKSKSSNRSNQNFVCAEGTESLNLQLEQTLEDFERSLRSSRGGSRSVTANANDAFMLCQEYFNMNPGASCISQDSLNGQEITLGKEQYVESCNRAAEYADSSVKNQKTRTRSDRRDDRRRDGGKVLPLRNDAQALVDFRRGELEIKITDGQTLLRAAQNTRQRMAFVNGQLTSAAQAEESAQSGQVACAVQAGRGKFIPGQYFSVVEIRNHSRRQGQSVSLTTEDGLQISCQSNRSQALTPSSLKRAFGPVLDVRGARAH